MTVIWKYVLHSDENEIEMPADARILCAHEQRGEICIWAEVDPKRGTQRRLINVYGTGHPIAASAKTYIGTAFLEGGTLVFHVYEVGL